MSQFTQADQVTQFMTKMHASSGLYVQQVKAPCQKSKIIHGTQQYIYVKVADTDIGYESHMALLKCGGNALF